MEAVAYYKKSSGLIFKRLIALVHIRKEEAKAQIEGAKI